ncbi:MAG: aminotransferase class III-fold pyridoxal phosphate-dependent enzyme, partial [Ignavibacteriota bacterium]
MTKEEIILANKEYLFPAVFHFFQEPLVGRARQGPIRLGRPMAANISTSLAVSSRQRGPLQRTGERQSQAADGQRCSTSRPSSPTNRRRRWRRKIASLTPGRQLTKSFFTNSGTEANETAILAARCYTGNTEIVALRHSYHGRSAAAMTLSGQGAWRLGPSQAGVVHAHNAYCYRCPFGLTYPSCEVRCAQDMEDLIRTSTSGADRRLYRRAHPGSRRLYHAAQRVLPDRREDRAQSRRYFHISDEVQTGWGRTGGKWFGIEQWGVTPDVMTCAKGLGNGAPIGLTAARPEVADSVRGLTISTFGGNPVVATAAKAVIDYIEEMNLQPTAKRPARTCEIACSELQKRHSIVGDVRGMGLLQAIELGEDRQTKTPAAAATARLMEACPRRGTASRQGRNVWQRAPLLPAHEHQPHRCRPLLRHARQGARKRVGRRRREGSGDARA